MKPSAVFDDILQNKVRPGRQVPARWSWRDDVHDLIRRVARIYRPRGPANRCWRRIWNVSFGRPVGPVCNSWWSSRTCPLNVPRHDLNSVYAYVRQAVKAYGVYKSAEPYFPYLSSAFYLGRFAMGASRDFPGRLVVRAGRWGPRVPGRSSRVWSTGRGWPCCTTRFE